MRGALTTALDVAGVGSVVAGVALLWCVPGALVVLGVALLLASWRVTR